MINVDGKVYRNIQEQVKKNQEDIESCEEKIANHEKVIGNLQIDIDSKIPLSQKATANGVATLDSDKKIPIGQMPNEPTFVTAEIINSVRVVKGGVKVQDDANNYSGIDNFDGEDIDTTYYSKGLYVFNADTSEEYNLSFPAKSGTLATTDDIETSKYAYTYVNTTTYTTLDSFLTSTGESQYIYLYPIDTNDTSKGYYKYVWLNNAWFLDGQNSLQLIKGNIEATGDITQKLDTTNYFKLNGLVKNETTYTVNDKTFTYQDLVLKVSIIGNVMNILWIGQWKSLDSSITRSEMRTALNTHNLYIKLPPEIINKITTTASNLGIGTYKIIRGQSDLISTVDVPYVISNPNIDGNICISSLFDAGTTSDALIWGSNTWTARICVCINLSDNLIK